MEHPCAEEIPFIPPWVIEGSDCHAKAGGGVEEFIVSDVDAGVGYKTAGTVSTDKEDQITGHQFFPVSDDLSVPGLLL